MTTRFPGLVPVHRKRTAGAAVFEVTSWDDRFNLVGGLTYKARRRVVEGIHAALAGAVEGPWQQARRQEYAVWAGLEILRTLVERKRLRWGTKAPKRGGRGASQPDLLDLVPGPLRHPGYPLPDLPRDLGRIREELRKAVFEEGQFVANVELQRAVLDSLLPPGTPPPVRSMAARRVLQERKPFELPGGLGVYSHMSLAQVVEYYDLGQSHTTGTARGHKVAWWNVHALLERMEEGPGLDLRNLAWRRGQYELQR